MSPKSEAALAASVGSHPSNAPRHSKAEIGVASWYGAHFHGNGTASGETFNMRDLTAAHRKLPFGTQIKVTNLKNSKTVILRVNDRGPNTDGRLIDVSWAAA